VATSEALKLQHSDLNGFLHADIGIEASGMPLSVLSAFARLGKDPWQEAGRLAQMPQSGAIEGLARMITAIPATHWSFSDATAIAGRLVTLLPVPRSIVALASTQLGVKPEKQTRRQWIVLFVIAGLASVLVQIFISQVWPLFFG
jgi:hypothetical protein